MTAGEINSWQTVQEEVLRRIRSREWRPGDIIPNETDLSSEFGCARATVNRALRNLAANGLLDRKRKAGTRVALHPTRKATLDIPIIRREIEEKGLVYRYSMISCRRIEPPIDVMARMQARLGTRLLHIKALHMANGRPYVFENRWINSEVVPAALEIDFAKTSPNEWLVTSIPFEGGDITFSAETSGPEEAEILDCEENQGLFTIDRNTWSGGEVITFVRLVFAPGYRMHTQL